MITEVRDIISPQDPKISPQVRESYKKICGYYDIVGVGTGLDARLYVATVDNFPDSWASIIEINLNSIAESISDRIDICENEVLALATDGVKLYCCETEDRDIMAIELDSWNEEYINHVSAGWTGIAVFENVVFATDSNNGWIHTNRYDKYGDISTIIDIEEVEKKPEWIGVAVCGDALYAMNNTEDLYIYDKDANTFRWHSNIRDITDLQQTQGYKKIKGIGQYLYLIDNFWHLWRYDPKEPSVITEVCKELNNISSICELDGKLYVTQISGGIYEYTPNNSAK